MDRGVPVTTIKGYFDILNVYIVGWDSLIILQLKHPSRNDQLNNIVASFYHHIVLTITVGT